MIWKGYSAISIGRWDSDVDCSGLFSAERSSGRADFEMAFGGLESPAGNEDGNIERGVFGRFRPHDDHAGIPLPAFDSEFVARECEA